MVKLILSGMLDVRVMIMTIILHPGIQLMESILMQDIMMSMVSITGISLYQRRPWYFPVNTAAII